MPEKTQADTPPSRLRLVLFFALAFLLLCRLVTYLPFPRPSDSPTRPPPSLTSTLPRWKPSSRRFVLLSFLSACAVTDLLCERSMRNSSLVRFPSFQLPLEPCPPICRTQPPNHPHPLFSPNATVSPEKMKSIVEGIISEFSAGLEKDGNTVVRRCRLCLALPSACSESREKVRGSVGRMDH